MHVAWIPRPACDGLEDGACGERGRDDGRPGPPSSCNMRKLLAEVPDRSGMHAREIVSDTWACMREIAFESHLPHPTAVACSAVEPS